MAAINDKNTVENNAPPLLKLFLKAKFSFFFLTLGDPFTYAFGKNMTPVKKTGLITSNNALVTRHTCSNKGFEQ